MHNDFILLLCPLLSLPLSLLLILLLSPLISPLLSLLPLSLSPFFCPLCRTGQRSYRERAPFGELLVELLQIARPPRIHNLRRHKAHTIG